MTATPFSGSILCPVDFSEVSAAALRQAVIIGAHCSSAVTALHAQWFEVPPYFTAGQTARIEAELRNSLEVARSALRRFVGEAVEGDNPPNLPAIRVEEGDPAEAILRTAQSLGSGLIVMGTHGRTGIRQFTLGSVAQQVVHTSKIPVLTIHETAPAKAISNIVCAVNDSEVSRKALVRAAALATCLGAHLVAIHVQEGDNTRSIADLCDWMAERKPACCEIREVTRRGRAAEQIVRFVRELKADLLVVGAEHKLFLDKTVIGSTTSRLLLHAPCAILTVPAGE